MQNPTQTVAAPAVQFQNAAGKPEATPAPAPASTFNIWALSHDRIAHMSRPQLLEGLEHTVADYWQLLRKKGNPSDIQKSLDVIEGIAEKLSDFELLGFIRAKHVPGYGMRSVFVNYAPSGLPIVEKTAEKYGFPKDEEAATATRVAWQARMHANAEATQNGRRGYTL